MNQCMQQLRVKKIKMAEVYVKTKKESIHFFLRINLHKLWHAKRQKVALFLKISPRLVFKEQIVCYNLIIKSQLER